jgi:hypothetical protein
MGRTFSILYLIKEATKDKLGKEAFAETFEKVVVRVTKDTSLKQNWGTVTAEKKDKTLVFTIPSNWESVANSEFKKFPSTAPLKSAIEATL